MPSDELRLICWPFHNGLREVGMGAGALHLARDERLRQAVAAVGWRVADVEVPAVDESGAEIARVMELVRRLAAEVRSAEKQGAFPLVLAGNCNSSLGSVAGVGGDRLGVIWFDAHADFDDPDENTSGFFDVMALAMLTGRGWRALRATIPGHRPIPEPAVVLAGVRDLEPAQRERLAASAIHAVAGRIDPKAFDQALKKLASQASRIYLHVDLDSLDVSEAKANEYAAPGGPSEERLLECIRIVCQRFAVSAAAITAYDPALDGNGRTLAAARKIAREIAHGVRPRDS
jgi:arginase